NPKKLPTLEGKDSIAIYRNNRYPICSRSFTANLSDEECSSDNAITSTVSSLPCSPSKARQ
ncbi:5310_t:CDS:2, partial [Racocetra fulgida]